MTLFLYLRWKSSEEIHFLTILSLRLFYLTTDFGSLFIFSGFCIYVFNSYFLLQMLDYLGKSSDTDSSLPADFLLSRSRWRMLPRLSLESIVYLLCLFDWFSFMFIPAGRHWSTWFLHSITCIRITISGISMYIFIAHMAEKRIMGNAIVSLLGDLATH